jgi:predicted metal-binding membrane protein
MRIAALRVGSRPAAGDGPLLALGVPAGLLLLAVAGWWWSARMAGDVTRGGMDGTMSLGAFVLAWAAMMAAMMLPAVLPAVRLYARAAAKGRAAPVPFFVGGYVALWTAVAVPAYLAWRELEMPLAEGQAWAGRLAGATMLAAALWQITPLKSICLHHCRSPLGFFLRFGGRIRRPAGALRMGAAHGAFCFGCCWALFAVLVALGTMNLLWMVLFTALIVLEKHAPRGEQIAVAGALTLAAVGTALLTDPSMLAHLT